jgi:hypothetical protein
MALAEEIKNVIKGDVSVDEKVLDADSRDASIFSGKTGNSGLSQRR